MPGQRQVALRRFLLLFLAGTFGLPHLLLAQGKGAPTLDELLAGLDKNLKDYGSQIPSFFCRENVISQLVYGRHQQRTITDSIFRLKRIDTSDPLKRLAESREIVAVNGVPAKQKELHGPAILSGVFSRGLNIVSTDQESCMRYTLQPKQADKQDAPYIIQFATLPNTNQASCVFKEKATGRVFIDRDKMQVIRMELSAPHHMIATGYFGLWKISVDYVPVPLGEHTFWLPKTIVSTLDPKDENGTVWSFRAKYDGYHKLEVTSRILPFGGVSPQ